jgi:hypothetical protein
MADLKTSGLSGPIVTKYVPALNQVQAATGIKTLALAHAIMEGFYPGTPAYNRNNPGNIRSTSGPFIKFQSLFDGVTAQINYLQRIINGQHRAYPYGGNSTLKQYVYTYAPPSENKPENYIASIIANFGKQGYKITRDTTLNQIASLDTFGSAKKKSNTDSSGNAVNIWNTVRNIFSNNGRHY